MCWLAGPLAEEQGTLGTHNTRIIKNKNHLRGRLFHNCVMYWVRIDSAATTLKTFHGLVTL